MVKYNRLLLAVTLAVLPLTWLFAVTYAASGAADGGHDDVDFKPLILTDGSTTTAPEHWYELYGTDSRESTWWMGGYAWLLDGGGKTSPASLGQMFVGNGAAQIRFDAGWTHSFNSSDLVVTISANDGSTCDQTVSKSSVVGGTRNTITLSGCPLTSGIVYRIRFVAHLWMISDISLLGGGSYPAYSPFPTDTSCTLDFDSDSGVTGNYTYQAGVGYTTLGAIQPDRSGSIYANVPAGCGGDAFGFWWRAGANATVTPLEIIVNGTTSRTLNLVSDRWSWYTVDVSYTPSDTIEFRHPSFFGTTYYIDDLTFGNSATTPPAGGLPFAPSCTFAYTQTLTNTNGITSTKTTSYTVNSNLISNYSFEDGDNTDPSGWSPVKNGAVVNGPAGYYAHSNARTGTDAIHNVDIFDLYYALPLYSGGDYAAGFYATNGNDAALYWNGFSVVSASGVTSTYRLFTNTRTTGGGSSWLNLAFTAGDSSTYVDDVFVIPVDENGNLNCSPEFYPEPPDVGDQSDCLIDPGTNGCIPIPVGGAGEICYYCQQPSGASSLSVSYWIAWLACVIRNLFSCSLRVWLLVLGNWARGQIQMGLAWIGWLPGMVQAGGTWLMTEIVPAITEGINVTSSSGGSSFWDVLIALIDLINGVISSLSALMLGIINLIISFVDNIQLILSAQPYAFTFGGLTEPNQAALSAAGPNDSKIFYLFALAAVTIDNMLFGDPNIGLVLALVMAGVAIGVIVWTISHWQNFVEF